MREVSLDQLRTLVAIADLGSFSAAARSLHLAQPTVSLHIRELESRLGTPLLVRGTRGVGPTPAGATLVQRAREMLRLADEAVDAVKRQAEGRTGRVRLGTSTSVLAHVLPPVLERLQREHPGIDVDVSLLTSSEAMQRLQAGSLDIGLVAMPQPPQRELVLSPWRSDPMMAFLPASWKAPKRISAPWLAAKPLIFNAATTHVHRLTMDWFARAGQGPRPRVEMEATEAIKNLVAAGYGAAVLPLEGSVESGIHQRLQILPLQPRLTRHLSLAHRPVSALDGATRRVVELLNAVAHRR